MMRIGDKILCTNIHYYYMNKKILAGIIIAIAIAAIGIVSIKAILGDQATELPFEEKAEKSLNLQESGESEEAGESAQEEAGEYTP